MGVGKKVADCILIYSLGRKDAFPVDTWIRKASINLFGDKGLTDNEIRAKAYERFGNDSALAQQYMFIAERKG
jgi:N-glycosylase/DNA lyase